jgi:thioredoxin-dependent peroxiredoxin
MATKKKAAKKKAAQKKKAVSKSSTKKAVKKEPFKNYATHLKPGDKAPSFKGIDQNGKVISSADFKGKKLVVYFYPKDNTPTCTVQACNIRDNFSQLKKAGIEVIGVSGDNAEKHKKFETKFKLPFRMIADTDHSVINAFDVWGKKQFMGKIYDGIIRTTFLIDEKGILKDVIKKPDTGNHSVEILEYWGIK